MSIVYFISCKSEVRIVRIILLRQTIFYDDITHKNLMNTLKFPEDQQLIAF